MIRLLDGRVESPDATEAGSKGELRHRQGSFVDQFFGEVQTTGLSYRNRRGAEVLEEQAAKMARANAQAAGKRCHATAVQTVLADQLQRPRDRIASACPGWSSRRAFRAAPQTRSKS